MNARALASAALTAGCLVLGNVLAARVPLRLDLTEGRLFTLSPGSRRVLASLPGPVEARVYFSEAVEPRYAASRAYLRALLADARRASRGRLSVAYVDVDKDPKGKDEALQAGVAPVQFNVVSEEKFEVRDGFMGLSLRHADRREVIPVILDPSGLEHELVTRLARLSAKDKPVVGVAAGFGLGGPESLAEPVRAALELRAELREVDLAALKAGATVAADVAALAVLGPQEKLSEPAAAALEAYLLSGRPLFLAVDGRKADLRAFMASPLDSGLGPFLRKHGVSLRSTYVLDAQNQPVQVTQRRGFFTLANVIPYPLFPVVTDLDRGHPLTRELQSLSLPFATALHLSSASSGAVWTVLARSSPRSWVRSVWEKGFAHSISPLEAVAPGPVDPPGPYVLAAVSEGPFGPGAKPGGRLLVVGTAGFARPGLPVGESGAAFLLNAVDWMLQEEDLIAIRSKDVAERPLRELSPAAKAAARWTCVLLPPSLVVLLGLARRRSRRAADAARAARYAPAAA